MAMLLALLPCPECIAPMSTCVGCARFFQWLDVALVHQGRTKGFKNSDAVLELTAQCGWNVAASVEALYVNERDNAARILSETECGPDAAEFQYWGEKPFCGPASVFTMHRDELMRLAEEYKKCVLQVEAEKDKIRASRSHFAGDKPKELTAEQFLGPLGKKLKVAGRPIGEILFPGGGEIAG